MAGKDRHSSFDTNRVMTKLLIIIIHVSVKSKAGRGAKTKVRDKARKEKERLVSLSEQGSHVDGAGQWARS